MINKKQTYFIIGILLISIIGAFYYTGVKQQEFSINSVYLPNYVSIYCGRLPALATTKIIVSSNGYAESTCGVSGTGFPINAYTPNGCKYVMSNQNGWSTPLSYKIVNANENCNWHWYEDGNRFIKNTAINVNYKNKICIKSHVLAGTLIVDGSAVAYGLHINNANGKVIFTKNCDLKSNINNIKDIDYIPGFSTTPYDMSPTNSVNNYIVGYSPIVNSKDVVKYNGKRIYINAIGSYFPIEKSKDGYYFANSLKEVHDSSIICVPSNNRMCIDGRKIETKNQPCSMFNKPEGYVSIGNGIECKYDCTNNVLKKDNCRQIAECSGNTPWRNPITNVCESAGQNNLNKNQCSWYQNSYSKTNINNGFLNWRAWRSEERRVGKECRSRWSPYH